MGWKIFAGVNAIMSVRGSWRILRAGGAYDPMAVVGLVLGAVAALGLLAYAHGLSLGFGSRFWNGFCQLFALWSLASVAVLLTAVPGAAGRPGGVPAVLLAAGAMLVYTGFQCLALRRQALAEQG